jgi:bifunctional DNA-binding transcriptional regulator/antitoxin component of YhaV-PrlF toxin-antitoxin module
MAMLAQIIQIDKQGRIELPRMMREALGLFPETKVIIELTERGIFIRPKLTATPITQKISDMDLPISDWSRMEQEIEEGHLK